MEIQDERKSGLIVSFEKIGILKHPKQISHKIEIFYDYFISKTMVKKISKTDSSLGLQFLKHDSSYLKHLKYLCDHRMLLCVNLNQFSSYSAKLCTKANESYSFLRRFK